MSGFDDFGVNNDVSPDQPSAGEDRLDGTEDYMTEVWDSDQLDDVANDDDDTTEAESIPPEPSVHEMSLKEDYVEPDEAELSG
jgi:hypothetical protein